MELNIHKCILTQNDCYRAGRTIRPRGIVVHSTGANNPNLRRYVQPDDGLLGENPYGNHWNRPGLDVCVHAFIGRDKNGALQCYQTLPWTMRAWGVGSGKNGSYNDSHIQLEICEDGLTSPSYCRACFDLAAELCAHLCRGFEIPVESIVSHHEAYLQGYGSGHVDPDNWWPNHGLDMDQFRKKVAALLAPLYRVRRSWEDAASQVGAYASRAGAIAACPEGYTVFDPQGNGIFTRKEGKKMRFMTMGEVTQPDYRATLEKLVEKGYLQGRGGSGDDRVLDLGEESLRLLVILDRAGVFGV